MTKQKTAITDELTGAHNRRSLMDIGGREVQRSIRYDRALAALILDVDRPFDNNVAGIGLRILK